MNVKLDENLASQLNTMEKVKQLSADIVDMQERMYSMQQLLYLAIENQEMVAYIAMHGYCFLYDKLKDKTKSIAPY